MSKNKLSVSAKKNVKKTVKIQMPAKKLYASDMTYKGVSVQNKQ